MAPRTVETNPTALPPSDVVQSIPASGLAPARAPITALPAIGSPEGERRRRRRTRRRHDRHLRDAFTRRQRTSLAVTMAAWATLTISAWAWLVAPGHVGALLPFAVNLALIGAESLLLPCWFFFWVWRMRRPDPSLDPPVVRMAMVVTKAPSEPWPIVRETLEAMLTQDFPYSYDVWLADESPRPETLEWCEAHGVRVSSREGVAEYHRPTWPRRTRCKEGNLAYFYDMWGYDLYDIVVQLDADHVPDPDYLRHMTIPFRDALVGYVAAPSICDRNAASSWSARARLYAEAVLHGPMQAGHSGGFAPSCIGSHYAVRTTALHQIGGLGPELAEDFTTSLMMSSFGWQGVFAIGAHAHGDGPATVADCITQEFQWSRSMMNVLLGVNARYWNSLSRAAKVRLGFCQIWYPLFALLMAASIAVPVLAIATRAPAMRVGLGSFYVHFVPPNVVLVAVVLWLRGHAWLRPASAKVISWEVVLFQLVRWPWVLFGCLQAVAGRLRGREFAFKVTPKGEHGPQPLPLRVLVPYLVIAAIAATPALLHLDAGRAQGYYVLDLLNVALYLGAALAVIGLHIFDHPPTMRATVLRLSLQKLAATVAVGAALVFAIAVPLLSIPGEASAAAAAASVHRTAPLAIGVTTWPLAINSTTLWQPKDLATVTAFERLVHTRASIVMWYSDWAHTRLDVSQLRAVAAHGSEPEITWEPWDYLGSARQPAYSLASIIAGRHDAYIRTWALALRRFRRPVLLRFAQEMDGSWYPWSEGVNGNRRGQFVAAWRHVWGIFHHLRATNVGFVWSPVARGGFPLNVHQYPGNAYVDVVGLSGFNAGRALPRSWGGWRSFGAIFDTSLAKIAAIAASKPVQISEVATTAKGGNQTAWIKAMFADLAKHRQIRSLVWFDLNKQADWAFTSARAGRAFAAALRQLNTGHLRAAGARVS
jgi:cellulose synthase (UDP-forming)